MEKSRRKEKELQFRRGEILNVAETAFAERGYHSATMAEIAAQAGFAVGTLYQLFASKEEIYRSLIAERRNQMYQAMSDALAGQGRAEEKICNVVRAFFGFVEQHAAWCSLFVRREEAGSSSCSGELRHSMIDEFLSQVTLMESVMQQGVDERLLRPLAPRVMAFSLLGMLRGAVLDWMTTGRRKPLSEETAPMIEIFLRGVKCEDKP